MSTAMISFKLMNHFQPHSVGTVVTAAKSSTELSRNLGNCRRWVTSSSQLKATKENSSSQQSKVLYNAHPECGLPRDEQVDNADKMNEKLVKTFYVGGGFNGRQHGIGKVVNEVKKIDTYARWNHGFLLTAKKSLRKEYGNCTLVASNGCVVEIREGKRWSGDLPIGIGLKADREREFKEKKPRKVVTTTVKEVGSDKIALLKSNQQSSGGYPAVEVHGEGTVVINAGRIKEKSNETERTESNLSRTKPAAKAEVVAETETFVLIGGNKYVGALKDGLPDGHGTMYCSQGEYEGEWALGRQIGQCVMVFANGARYAGEWRDTAPHGTGTMVYPVTPQHQHQHQQHQQHQHRYEGQWAQGQYHGQGTLHDIDGSVYEGDWAGGKKSGTGAMVYPDGSQYGGSWAQDLPHGTQGMFIHPVGDPHQRWFLGSWRKGLRHGKGRLVTAAGEVFENQKYAAGELVSGPGLQIQRDGSVWQGTWANGKMHGRGRQTSAAGEVVCEGEFREGVLVVSTSTSTSTTAEPIPHYVLKMNSSM